MTTKGFNIVAALLKKHFTADYIIMQFAERFEDEFPRFQKDRFLDAAGYHGSNEDD